MSKESHAIAPPRQPSAKGFGGFGSGHGARTGEKAKNFSATMRQLAQYMRPFWTSVVIVFVLAVLSTSFAIAGPKILGKMTNIVVDGYIERAIYDQFAKNLPVGTAIPTGTTGSDLLTRMPADAVEKIPAAQLEKIKQLDFSKRPGFDFAAMVRIAELLVALYLVSAVFNYLQGWIMTNVSQKITFNLRRDIAKKIDTLPLKYFDTRTHGEVLSRITNDVDTVSQTLNQSLAQIVTSITAIIGVLILMLTISWQLTLVALLILPISFACIGFIVSRSQQYFARQQETLSQLNGHIEEMFSGHTVMKVYNGKDRSIAKFQAVNGELYQSAWMAQFLSGLMMPIMSVVGNLGFVGVSVLGGYLATKGLITIGDIQAFIQYMNQFTQPITQAANTANILQSTAAAAERVFEFLAEPAETSDQENPVCLPKMQGNVTFKNVVFGYTPEQTVIRNFTANIPAGSRVAIVGPTGAGKTTLVNLLMRFYEVDKGTIEIDGVNTRAMRRADVRQLFGMVLQDTWLFTGSVEENIAYSRPDASHDDVINAAKAAHADHFIRALPDGYKMQLNEEADNISQGEKQLLTIARAMLANAPMLILDEATSSVDTRTEALIQQAMDRLMKGKTSFVIAHRLSTIRNADLILVLNDGNIVEQGTHDELINKHGFYAKLYESQFATSNL